MSGFITKSACSGRRPSQFARFDGYQRASIMTRLLKDRSVPRFVVAPTGYGKSSLLVDYAETMFAWVHVFWINGLSPCFIRDIDEGSIARDCLAVDKAVRLVVFDDVPYLDGDRAQRFSDEIDQLLAGGCEVIAACTPQCDVYGRLQRDRMRLGARDLLLDDDELDMMRSSDERARVPASQISQCARVPALAWHDDLGAAGAFVRNSLRERMPSEVLRLMASMFVLQGGQMEALKASGLGDVDALAECSSDYPHFRFDYDAGVFEAPSISVDEMAPSIRAVVDGLLEDSCFEGRDELVWAWANMSVEAGQGADRACAIIRNLCARARRTPWLAAHAEQLVKNACFYEGFALTQSLRATQKGANGEARATCLVYESICRVVMEDVDGAIRCAKRLAFEDSTPLAERICALFIVCRYGNETLRRRADESLRAIASAREDVPIELLSPWVQLAVARKRLMGGFEELVRWWNELRGSAAPRFVLLLVASWFYDALADGYAAADSDLPFVGSDACVQLERFVKSELSAADESGLDFYEMCAGLSLEKAHVQGMPFTSGSLSARVLLLLRQAEMSLLAQKARFEAAVGAQMDGEEGIAHGAKGAPVALSAMAQARPKRSVPTLKIKMFGRFEASIGGVPLDDGAFRRKHVRLMLLALSMNAGHDMSRSELAHLLWPDAPDNVARRNFYTAWSRLRKALLLSDGTCPYLVRHQYGCGLEDHCVQSDVARLHEICRELLFGRPNSKSWSRLYAEIDRAYANDLLPSESDDEYVLQARAECRGHLVDALVSATQSIIDERDYQLAIWFARSAVGHDETREDAYVALMRAQAAAGQRTAAMMTYHKCRRALAERLGVDPSPETTALYEEMLQAE